MAKTFRIFIDDTAEWEMSRTAGQRLVEVSYAKNLQELSFQFVKVIDNGRYFFARKDVDEATIVYILEKLSMDYGYEVKVTTVKEDRFTVHLTL